MIESPDNSDRNSWQWQLRNTIGLPDLAELFPDRDFSGCSSVDSLFPVRITPYYLDLIMRESPDGPLHRMALPSVDELESGGYTADPFEECSSASRCLGVKQRFSDRVLVMTSSRCAVNCRHCTRRGVLKEAAVVNGAEDLTRAVDFVKSAPAVREVLLSGGDPLVLDDDALMRFVNAFVPLKQIDAIRIGTRIPVTLPMRITETLAGALGESGKLWINTQFNHRSEITSESTRACCLLVKAGIPVSNQSVLLRGVNDSADAMFELCAGLQRIRVRPYYVFQCDPVAGIDHFRVEREVAVEIERQLAERLGGLALPRFVRDLPGALRKLPLC
jgi:lysine 2,3-aminomutase